MRVRDVMTRGVRVLRPEASLEEAANMMASLDVGALPVCEGDRVVGVVTDRDITVRGTARGMDPGRTRVSEVLTRGVMYCFESDDVRAVARAMEAAQIRRVPVLGKDRRLVGIVALADIARHASEELAGDLLEGISERSHRERHIGHESGHILDDHQEFHRFSARRDHDGHDEHHGHDEEGQMRDRFGRSWGFGRDEDMRHGMRGHGEDRRYGYGEGDDMRGVRGSYRGEYGGREMMPDQDRLGYGRGMGRGHGDQGYGMGGHGGHGHDRGYGRDAYGSPMRGMDDDFHGMARGMGAGFSGGGYYEGHGHDDQGRFGRQAFGGGGISNSPGYGWGQHQGTRIGRGPKGYKRSDERIREDICDRLAEYDDVDATDVTVKVQAGEVTLEGTVPARHHKLFIERIADSVRGVQEVMNQIRVKREGQVTGAHAHQGGQGLENGVVRGADQRNENARR